MYLRVYIHDMTQTQNASDMMDFLTKAPAPVDVIRAEDQIKDLADWLATQTWSTFAQSLASFYARKGYLSEKQIAAGLKMKAKCDAKAKTAAAAAPATEVVTEPGMYQVGETIYKVQKSQAGRLYAKVLEHGHFEYAPGVIKVLTPAHKMTADQAAAYGKIHGNCVRCGKDLTDERSLTVGYGSTCAAREGWPWGEVAEVVL